MALCFSIAVIIRGNAYSDLKPRAVAELVGGFHLTCCIFSLCQVEKRLELVKQVSHSTHKKLTACLQGQQGVDVDKKSVRSPSVSSRKLTSTLIT